MLLYRILDYLRNNQAFLESLFQKRGQDFNAPNIKSGFEQLKSMKLKIRADYA